VDRLTSCLLLGHGCGNAIRFDPVGGDEPPFHPSFRPSEIAQPFQNLGEERTFFFGEIDSGPEHEEVFLSIHGRPSVEDEGRATRPSPSRHIVPRVGMGCGRKAVGRKVTREPLDEGLQHLLSLPGRRDLPMPNSDEGPEQSPWRGRPFHLSFVHLPVPRSGVIPPGEKAERHRGSHGISRHFL
jgi:hypothetical protein